MQPRGEIRRRRGLAAPSTTGLLREQIPRRDEDDETGAEHAHEIAAFEFERMAAPFEEFVSFWFKRGGCRRGRLVNLH